MRRLIVLSVIICSIVHSYAASAIEVDVDGINYRINDSNKTATVVGLNTKIANVEILEYIDYNNEKYPVTEIQREAFANQSDMESIKIPDTIIEIGYKAFWFCRNLKNVIWGQSLETIGNSAFFGCSSLKEAILPNSIKAIGTMAFEDCHKLETVNIPTSLTEIYQSAFEGCENLKNIHIDDIGAFCSAFIYHAKIFSTNAALYSNGNLISKLIIPQEVENIASLSFCGCGSIESVTFPPTLKSIGYSSFEGCPNLKEINIFSDAIIDQWVFGTCAQLTTINAYTIKPPTIDGDVFHSSYPEYMTLHVPKGCKETYINTNGWKDFGTIIDDLVLDEISNIIRLEVNIDQTKPVSIYTSDGTCVFYGIPQNFQISSMSSGFYIIKQGEKTKKTFIR